MSITSIAQPTARPDVLVTGGCGFLGSNIADKLAADGRQVRILDSMERVGSRENAEWLKARHGDRVLIERADVRDAQAVRAAVENAAAIMHLAGQVAVTTSLQEPLQDFEINVGGTLNVLEAVRCHNPGAPVIFASTNKVYGRLLHDANLRRTEGRYALANERFSSGVAESTPLDFYSPYGCSKGAADQYVRDYARVFGLRTVVLRMSCIYGPRQFGTEDQGWIAHFLIQAMRGRAITIYGDGYQVRDTLYVDDAVKAWIKALDQIDRVAGRVFNLGGGATNTVSLRELLGLMSTLRGGRPVVRFADWRPGDQPWYVSDIRAISAALDWAPATAVMNGLRSLERWLEARFSNSTPSIPLEQVRA
ncbi:MAG TPA: SDR family NAD(P)-dependent oxidoreductase [Xanthobacteraceae bacterium]|nr:SDR family NAD(P)-dependent oxidoreductase [Xanthobacteraceae bacterium]